MLLKPTQADFRHIVHDLGRIMGLVGVAGLVPLGWAAANQEWAPFGHILIMVGLAAALAGAGQLLAPSRGRHKVDWSHGMVVVALIWLLVPAIGTIPLWMSGHYGKWLDAYFDAMSGITTTGLSVVQDIDHLASSVVMWRHVLHFLGGQGIVLAALTFFSASGALSLYQAEGREERIFPSVGTTARFIWLVSLVHGAVGITALSLDGIFVQGFHPVRAIYHASTIFMAAFDTGGFAPQSTSIYYYHSPLFEGITAVFMVAGAMSFGLHHALWQRRRGLLANLEVRTILATTGTTIAITIVGLAALGTFPDVVTLVRHGVFQVLSAHSGTGFATVSTGEMARWTGLAFVGMTIAMALGGMSSSTAGGVKSLRIGLTLKAMADSIREALLPEHAVVSNSYTQYGRQRLNPSLAVSVMAVSLLYVALYLIGGALGYAYGFPLDQALFESVSASANVGLSVGLTSPTMPVIMEVVSILQMYVGRLEFIAFFALLGFGLSMAVGE